MDTNVHVMTVRLGADAELKYTKTGKAVCRFRGASNKKLKGGDEVTSWFDFELWEARAETLAQYLKKGVCITASCEAKQDTWEDADGNSRSKVVFVVKEVEFHSSLRRSDGSQDR